MAAARVAVAICLVIGAVARTPGAPPQKPQFRGGTDTVPVYVTVVDRAGSIVGDLTREDFEVYDNGVRRELTVFANTTQPITVVVMLDRSGSVRSHYRLVERAAEAFVRHLLPDDRARIGSFSDGVRIDPETFTSDREELLRILRDGLLGTGPTPLWQATDAAIDALAPQDGRRVVLLFTDGKDAPGPVALATRFDDVRDRVQREEIMVYAIGLANTCPPPVRIREPAAGVGPARFDLGGQRGGFPPPPQRPPIGPPRFPIPLPLPLPPTDPRIPGGTPRDPRRTTVAFCRPSGPDPGLQTLTDASGGGFFELEDSDHLDSTFRRVADELHQQYLLGFDTPARDGRVHRLEVRVHRSGVTARARQTYIAK
jgi:VWFA-related protein